MPKNEAFVGTRTISSVKALRKILKKLFKKFFQKSNVYYLLQQSNKIDEIRSGLPDLDQLQQFAEGRAFDMNMELRWKRDNTSSPRRNDNWNLLVLNDTKAVKKFIPLAADVGWEVQNGKDCYLSGIWNQKLGQWIAPRLSRELEYPTFSKPDMDKAEPMVETVNYCEKNTKTIRFIRLKGVKVKEG